jgi:hypothetical protein
MIANQELNKKVRALTGETTPCDVNGNPCRDYAGDISEAWELVQEITRQDGYSVEVRDNGISFNAFCVIAEDGGIIATASGDTAPRAICLAYIAWKERTNEKINQ